MMEQLNTVLTDNVKVAFIIVVIVLAMEMLSGVMKAIKNKNLDSTKFREGLMSKSGYFLLIGLVLMISMAIQMPYLLYSILIWVVCSESVSVLENLSELGIKFPNFLKDVLEKTKKATEDEISENK